MNAVEIEEAISQLAMQPFDAVEFPFSFLEAFGNKSTTIKRLRNTGKSSTNASEKNKTDLTHCAENILLAREAHFPKTITDLYKPEDMPDNLRHAHEQNDETLERIYIGRRFKNDTERLEKLFELYTKMTSEESDTKEKKP